MAITKASTLATAAIKQINLAVNDGAVTVSINSKTADAFKSKLSTLAKSQPSAAFGLLMYMHELKENGRLTFPNAGNIPNASSAQGNAYAAMTNDAKDVLMNNDMISDNMKQDMVAR